MALTTSIKINGRDVRSTYGLEILSHEIHDLPGQQGENFKPSGRDGQIAGIQTYEAKQLKLSGYIDQTTHALLLTAIDNLKKALYGGHLGRAQFTIEFTDYTDRYFLGRVAGFKVYAVEAIYISTRANVELVIILDGPFGVYDTLALSNISGSPFSSPFSFGYSYGGSAISRPRIFIENTINDDITSLTIINTSCKSGRRNISATAANITRATGRWSDIKGAAAFAAASSPSLAFACRQNFNPGCFTIFMFFYPTGTASPDDYGYLFSTTSNTVRLYHYDVGTELRFDINGTVLAIGDSQYNLTANEWYAVAASYDGTNMNLSIYRISTDTLYVVEPTTVTYRGLPTNIYIGTDASGGNGGVLKRLDDVRLFNYVLNGMGANPASGSELEYLYKATGPLPIKQGCTLYLPFDYKLDGLGMANTSLVIIDTLSQNEMYEIDCERMVVYALTAGLATNPSAIMDKVSGEFPFLVPGTNGIQIIHDGAASSLNMAIEDKRRFL